MRLPEGEKGLLARARLRRADQLACFPLASARELLEYVFREHTIAGESGALTHQFRKDFLPVLADKGHIPEVDNQLAVLQVRVGRLPC